MSIFPTTMMTYINEESFIFKTVLNNYQTKLKPFIDYVKTHSIKRCLILATGSSFNAGLCTKYYFENKANILVELKEPFNFNYYEKLDPQTDIVIAISQSGKSTSTIDALDKIRSSDIPIFVLTADIQSTICQKADYILDINCGKENVGFVTKGFLMTVLNLQLMALILAKQNYSISKDSYNDSLQQLYNISDLIPEIIIQTLSFFKKNSDKLIKFERFIALGYGSSYGIAKEFETKFTETIRLPSTGFELEAYMHGPYLEANKNHCLFFIENNNFDEQYYRSLCLKNYLSNYVGQIYTISTGKLDRKDNNNLNIDIPIDHHLSPLITVIPFQILAYQIATEKGVDLNVRIFDDFDLVLKSKI